MSDRINAGYTITDSIHIGTSEFVLGVNKSEPQMYVTWKCDNGSYYYWGHYTEDRREAERDLLARAQQELERQEHRAARSRKETERER